MFKMAWVISLEFNQNRGLIITIKTQVNIGRSTSVIGTYFKLRQWLMSTSKLIYVDRWGLDRIFPAFKGRTGKKLLNKDVLEFLFTYTPTAIPILRYKETVVA